MNSTDSSRLKEIGARAYQQGFSHGVWHVYTDLLGLFPVCKLSFFREQPTEDLLRRIYGSRFLHFAHFSPHEGGQLDGNSSGRPSVSRVESYRKEASLRWFRVALDRDR
jgi:hypothetical protein